MLLYIITTSTIIFSVGIGYISARYKRKALENAKQVANSYTREYANLIKYSLDTDFGVCRGMAQSFLYYPDISETNREQIHNEILQSVLVKNENFIATFLQWEYSKFDTTYKKEHGRQRFIYYIENPILSENQNYLEQNEKKLVYLQGIVDTVDFDPENPYYIVKNTGNEFIINPYFYSYDNAENMPEYEKISQDAILETTLIIPIYLNDEFYGIAGCDIPLYHFQTIIKQIEPFDESYAFMLGNNGKLVAHPNSENLGRPISEILPNDFQKNKIAEKIQDGQSFSFLSRNNETKTLTYITFAPIKIGRTTTPWSIAIAVPVNVIMKEANRHFYISIAVGIIGLIILTIIIWLISRSITRPIIKITNLLKELSKGKIDKTKQLKISTKDEIGDITKSTNILIEGLNKTAVFAGKIGEGNIDAKYTLLSSQDTLGHSLIEMRTKLKSSYKLIEENLEQIKHAEQNVKNSIIYASRIQTAILPTQKFFNKYFSDYFVFFKPRDIVSGDFYWSKKANETLLVAVADCTGHGVPGAFVSMLGVSLLNEISTRKEITQVNQILNELRKLIKSSLRQTGKENDNRDGMDIAICAINQKTKLMQYAGAYNSLFFIRKNTELSNKFFKGISKKNKIKIYTSNLYKLSRPEVLSNIKTDIKIIEIKADRQPIGIYLRETPFENNTIQLQDDDIIYLFTDGFQDQFGGQSSNEKFQRIRFKQMILSVAEKSMSQQHEIVEKIFNNWRINNEQIDDILVVGIKI